MRRCGGAGKAVGHTGAQLTDVGGRVEVIPVVETAVQSFGQVLAHDAVEAPDLVIHALVHAALSPLAAARDPGDDQDGALVRCWQRRHGLVHGMHGVHGRDCSHHAFMLLHDGALGLEHHWGGEGRGAHDASRLL